MPPRGPGGIENSMSFSVADIFYGGGSTPATYVLSAHGTGHFARYLRTCCSGVRCSLSG
jgi:hypothetical protein